MELKLLSSLAKSREAFNQVEHFVSSTDLSPLGSEIYKDIAKFYEYDDSATCVDLQILQGRVHRRIKNSPLRDKLDEIFVDIRDTDASPANVVAELLNQKREQLGHDLANAILTGDSRSVPELLASYQNVLDAEDLSVHNAEEYTGASLSSIMQEHFSEEAVIRVSPRSLNERLGGGLRRGHHAVVVALPETGKTLLSVHIAVGIARYGRKVLYIGNEEPIRDILVRSVACMSGKPKEYILDNPDEAEAIARSLGYDNITFAGLDPGTLWEISALVRKHQPDVLIVDQIRHVRAKSENRTTQLEAVAQGIRNIARQHDLVAISITQGADSARDKLVMDMGDVDSSNVGIPGACDVMLMMGSNEEYRRIDARMMTLAKNKVSGNHDSWPISIIPKISRVVDQ